MFGSLAKKIFGSVNDRRLKSYRPKVAAINAMEAELAALSDEALRARTDAFKAELAAGRSLDDILVPANASPARRDAEWMGQIYGFLGLSVGVIVHGLDDVERAQAYACDITYGTNNEYGFDYLRDNMKYEFAQMVQRGHNYAIVDEVDSILSTKPATPSSSPAR